MNETIICYQTTSDESADGKTDNNRDCRPDGNGGSRSIYRIVRSRVNNGKPKTCTQR